MRGLIDRRAVAILSRSRGPGGACLQRLSFSVAGRGRGRGDIEDAPPVPEAKEGAGPGLGLGSFGIGRGRGRGNVSPSPPPVSSQPRPPYKPFSLRPSPAVVAEKPTPLPEPETKVVADTRFEDAVAEKDVKPFKPFTLKPVESSPVVAAEKPAQAPESVVADIRFEDAVAENDVKPPLGVAVSEAAGEGDRSEAVEVSTVGEGDGSDVLKADVGEADDEESKRLLSFRGLLKIAPQGGNSQDTPLKVPFNPFNLPTTPSPSIFGAVAGRGRGAPLPKRGGAPRPPQAPIGAAGEETPARVPLSREEARARAMALLAKGEEQRSQKRASSPPPSSPAAAPAPERPQLSREDAVQRAVAVMKEGVERNLSREEERRRRRGSVDSFSDVTSMVADRFQRRAPSQQPGGSQAAKDRVKRQPQRFIRRRDQEEEPQVPQTLREMTPEDEKRLIAMEEEEQFKSSLHSKFLVDFEPEYAMEYFGINPDIDELPQKSLEEILAEAKPFLMGPGMTDEEWDGEVKDVLEKAPHLENLVNVYAGPKVRLTAREQMSKLQAVSDTMPAHVAPEIQDFMSKALLSLQSNPGIRMKEKERLMNKFVSGFSSF